MTQDSRTPIFAFIEDWIETHRKERPNSDIKTGSKLFEKAGLPNALFTQMRNGSEPRQKTIRALASAMNVPRARLFRLAGYIDDEDLIVQNPDPLVEEAVLLIKQIHPDNVQLLMTILHSLAEDGQARTQQQD